MAAMVSAAEYSDICFYGLAVLCKNSIVLSPEKRGYAIKTLSSWIKVQHSTFAICHQHIADSFLKLVV